MQENAGQRVFNIVDDPAVVGLDFVEILRADRQAAGKAKILLQAGGPTGTFFLLIFKAISNFTVKRQVWRRFFLLGKARLHLDAEAQKQSFNTVEMGIGIEGERFGRLKYEVIGNAIDLELRRCGSNEQNMNEKTQKKFSQHSACS
jgi:hypothetical protein